MLSLWALWPSKDQGVRPQPVPRRALLAEKKRQEASKVSDVMFMHRCFKHQLPVTLFYYCCWPVSDSHLSLFLLSADCSKHPAGRHRHSAARRGCPSACSPSAMCCLSSCLPPSLHPSLPLRLPPLLLLILSLLSLRPHSLQGPTKMASQPQKSNLIPKQTKTNKQKK